MTKSIVLTVCEERGITADEFFGYSRNRKLVAARRAAIERLREAGFSFRGISRAMRRSYSTVQYWMHPEYRDYRKTYAQKYHAEHPVPRTRKIATVKRKHLIEVYLSQGIHAAKPLAIEYGINPLTISRYARELGIRSKPGRPRMEAPRVSLSEQIKQAKRDLRQADPKSRDRLRYRLVRLLVVKQLKKEMRAA